MWLALLAFARLLASCWLPVVTCAQTVGASAVLLPLVASRAYDVCDAQPRVARALGGGKPRPQCSAALRATADELVSRLCPIAWAPPLCCSALTRRGCGLVLYPTACVWRCATGGFGGRSHFSRGRQSAQQPSHHRWHRGYMASRGSRLRGPHCCQGAAAPVASIPGLDSRPRPHREATAAAA